MRARSSWKRYVILALFVITALGFNVIPAAAVQVGNDEINFIQVLYNYPSAGQSTWYYEVISGSQPSISHVLFELDPLCLRLWAAGTWDGTDPSSLTVNGGQPSLGTDGSTGYTGLKFDEGFNDGEVRYYYFTLDALFVQSDMVTVVSKGGNSFDTAQITGPAVACPAASPGLSLVKTVNGDDANSAPGIEVIAGDSVLWEYLVTNTGNVDLANIAVTDDQEGAICTIAALASGQSATCSQTGVAIQGQYTNVGTATATYDNTPITASDPANYFGKPRFVANPLIDIEKLVNGVDADEAYGPKVLVGSTVTWEYIVTNSGNVDLTNVVVTDNKIGQICTAATLAVGQTITCTATGTAIKGQYSNIGTATGSYNGTTVQDSDAAYYLGVYANPKIIIKKLTNNQDADEKPGPSIPVGSVVTWKYVVHNAGNVDLTNIKVYDSVIAPNQNQPLCTIAVLHPQETFTCTATGIATAGQYMNVGKVTAFYGTTLVKDNDYSHYYGVQ